MLLVCHVSFSNALFVPGWKGCSFVAFCLVLFMLYMFLTFSLSFHFVCTEGILAVCKKNSQFLCNDEQPTFLVGANQAWFNYATGDFGNRLYFTISMIPLQTYLTTLKAAGGNSISMLVVKYASPF